MGLPESCTSGLTGNVPPGVDGSVLSIVMGDLIAGQPFVTAAIETHREIANAHHVPPAGGAADPVLLVSFTPATSGLWRSSTLCGIGSMLIR